MDILLQKCSFKTQFFDRYNLINKTILNAVCKMLIHLLSTIAIFSVFSSFFEIIDSPNYLLIILFLAVGDMIGQLLVTFVSRRTL